MPGARARSLLTMLFTDIVGSTQLASEMGDEEWRRLLEAHDAAIRQELQRQNGREIKVTGDGFLAVFSLPGEGVECARAAVAVTRLLGIDIRVGLHCGEVEVRGDDVAGLGVHVAARIAALAGPGEVLLSDTVRDLLAGSELSFQPRGVRALKGVPGRRKLFALEDLSLPRESVANGHPRATATGATSRKKTPPVRKRASKATPAGQDVKPVRVLLADDHPLWRQTLRGLLEHDGRSEIVAEAADGREAVAAVVEHGPDVVLMDVDMPVLDGIMATAELADRATAKVLVLSAVKERDQVLAAVRAGACGYMLKTAGGAEIADAVRRIHGGEVVFPPELTPLVLAELAKSPPEPRANGIRVAVAAARAVVREGLATLLAQEGFDVVSRYTDATDADDAVERGAADVAVVAADDSAVPAAGNRMLVVADTLDRAAILEVGNLSAGGYILKQQLDDPRALADAVQRVAAGEVVLDRQFVDELLTAKRAPSTSPLDALTPRENEVLALMAQGHSNQAIANRLFLGGKTVEGHIAGIFSKLGLEATPHDHRRVKAVLAYLQSAG